MARPLLRTEACRSSRLVLPLPQTVIRSRQLSFKRQVATPTLDIYTQISDPEVARMVKQVTNRILGLGEEGESSSVQ